ncbi:uncharacterized protein LOC118466194 [Anopheles albimanus]|uniref:uncharacterized protein LOC118466194 n=1 Tax=Anopheles albimanus TaxID=7167 RepID=UPI001641775F|nr:uncharacterized protein LOC118466194 [Anopheles albimanus]
MDGLPIYANGRKQFWPILGKIREEPKWRPFAIGIFYGHSKPKRVEEYLEYLVKELKLILEQGMTINGFRVTVTIRVIICDSPARAFIKGKSNFSKKFTFLLMVIYLVGCIGFNAFHGCPKCTTVGNRRGTYRVGECPARSDTMYRSFQYGEHHQVYKFKVNNRIRKTKIKTPLLELGSEHLDIVKDIIVSDSLHLLHLGVMKRMLVLFTEGSKYHSKFPPNTITAIDNILQQIHLPCEIHRRKFRSVKDIGFWKGTEFAAFLNYAALPIFKTFLITNHYETFLYLFCAVTICSSNYYRPSLDVARDFFQTFVSKYADIFKIVTSNIHCLTHIVEEVDRFGPLHTFSSYPFEDFLHQLKRTVRSGNKPLEQVINCIAEISCIKPNRVEEVSYPLISKPERNDDSKFSMIVVRDGLTLKNNCFADKWFLNSSFEVVAFQYATANKNIIGKVLNGTQSVFEAPSNSADLHISSASNGDSFQLNNSVYSSDSIVCKLVALSLPNEIMFIPLHHTLPCT